MCVFRFKMWWMTQRMGNCGQDIPFETQFLIVEAHDCSNIDAESKGGMDQSALYTVFLPILEGDFRAVLQGNEQNELEICLESGMKKKNRILGIYLSDQCIVILAVFKMMMKIVVSCRRSRC
jgi:raffinose synthase